MADYVSQFDDYLRNTKRASENTRLSYLRDVEAFFLHLRSIPLEPVQVSTGIVRSYLDSLRAVGRSETTILRNLASIRCLYKFFIMQGYIAANPTRDIKLNHVDKKLPQILTGEEIRLLLEQPDLESPKGCRDKAMLELLYATGIRVSELINLDVKDVNLRSRTLVCSGARAERSIPIYPSAVVAVSDYLYRVRDLLLCGESGDALFINLNGYRLTRQGFWKIIKEYANAAGITKEITPHTLRHSFALHLLENGASIRDIQTMLGHADVSSTQVYTLLMDNHVKEVYNKCHPRAKHAR